MGEETNVMEQLAIMMAKIENMGSELKSDLRSLTERVNALESQPSSPKAQDIKKKGVLQDHSSAIKFSTEELSEVENFSRSKGGKAQLGEIMEIAKSIQATLKELERKKKEEAMLAMETFAAVHKEAPVQTNPTVEKVHEKNMEEPRKDHVTITLKSDMSLKIVYHEVQLRNSLTTSEETLCLASVICKYGEDGCSAVTTRQNCQFLGVVLCDVPEMLKVLQRFKLILLDEKITSWWFTLRMYFTSSLIKHLDHKNVMKQQGVQVNMVNVATCLALHAKQQASGAMTAVIADLIKHLRKCLQNAAESDLSADVSKQNSDLQQALDKCISELSNKVGDVGPILDMVAVVLEMISTNVLVARTTASAILFAAHIVSVVPNVSYHKKVFPDALFHQLLLAMSHTDYETRVDAHNIFSVLLLRTLLLPWSDQYKETSNAVRSQSISLQEEERDKVEEILDNDLRKDVNHISHPSGLSCQSLDSLKDGAIKSLCSLRLSSHQVNMLLTSLWIQATSTENTPANFEAMTITFNTTLLFSLAKKSNHMALVQCFQLAFSLRNLSLNQDGGWQLSRRRSIFTFASYLLIFSAKISNIPELIPVVKESLTIQMV
ncbi:protein SEMI-ROLLED LEAF 2-like [Raphanus sativus]|uniref:Protein SEMI-ROLLED LEAF 2-like n=2 Tax=Raphanus sativus TaxID=3726 RepID=A0A9W3DEG6_RAPSA|nr:protein SEMI-ROLLED LEAF 2-like [Raphanus sativus]